MPDLKSKFETSVFEVKQLAERPDNETLLNLYAIYKQATAGNVSGKRPGFTDFVGRAKYDAWAKLKDDTKEEAMQQYIALVEKLKG